MHGHLLLSHVQATLSDGPALAELRVAAMRDSLERIGRFDPVRARARFLSGFVPADTRHIVRNGERIGFFVIKAGTQEWLLDHLYIHPDHQGQGVGAAVLGMIFAEVDAVDRPLRVGALRDSDSNRFYMRHGFVPAEQGEFDNYYVRPSRTASG